MKKRPSVPVNVADVDDRRAEVAPRADGRKSRCSDVTMMTKRSNHMPMLMRIETTNITGMLVRMLLEPEDLRDEARCS